MELKQQNHYGPGFENPFPLGATRCPFQFMHTFNWIKDFLKDKKIHRGLKDLIPDIFDTYLLIPWTVGIIDNFPFADYPDNKDTIESLNKQHAIEREFGIFMNDNKETKYRETTLKEIAERIKVQYCAYTECLIKSTPGTSPLLTATTRKFKELLNLLQNNTALGLYIEDHFPFKAGYANWKFDEKNIVATVADYLTFQQDAGWDSTSYLFPNNLKWCLCTVEDFQHFIFCCDNSTYQSLQDIKNLETFEVGYDFQMNWVCA